MTGKSWALALNLLLATAGALKPGSVKLSVLSGTRQKNTAFDWGPWRRLPKLSDAVKITAVYLQVCNITW